VFVSCPVPAGAGPTAPQQQQPQQQQQQQQQPRVQLGASSSAGAALSVFGSSADGAGPAAAISGAYNLGCVHNLSSVIQEAAVPLWQDREVQRLVQQLPEEPFRTPLLRLLDSLTEESRSALERHLEGALRMAVAVLRVEPAKQLQRRARQQQQQQPQRARQQQQQEEQISVLQQPQVLAAAAADAGLRQLGGLGLLVALGVSRPLISSFCSLLAARPDLTETDKQVLPAFYVLVPGLMLAFTYAWHDWACYPENEAAAVWDAAVVTAAGFANDKLPLAVRSVDAFQVMQFVKQHGQQYLPLGQGRGKPQVLEKLVTQLLPEAAAAAAARRAAAARNKLQQQQQV